MILNTSFTTSSLQSPSISELILFIWLSAIELFSSKLNSFFSNRFTYSQYYSSSFSICTTLSFRNAIDLFYSASLYNKASSSLSNLSSSSYKACRAGVDFKRSSELTISSYKTESLSYKYFVSSSSNLTSWFCFFISP